MKRPNLSEIMMIGLGAGAGVLMARALGKFLYERPMTEPGIYHYIPPTVIGFFVMAIDWPTFREMGCGMMAYGLGKLLYNTVIRYFMGKGVA